MSNLININVDIAFTTANSIRYYDNTNLSFNIAALMQFAPSLRKLQSEAAPANMGELFGKIASTFIGNSNDTSIELAEDETYRCRLSFVLDDEGNLEYHGSGRGDVPLELLTKLWHAYVGLIEKLAKM